MSEPGTGRELYEWTRWQIPEAPLREAYASQIPQAEADAYAEDAARSGQPAPLPSLDQVNAQADADEAAHAGETLPPGPGWSYQAPADAPPGAAEPPGGPA